MQSASSAFMLQLTPQIALDLWVSLHSTAPVAAHSSHRLSECHSECGMHTSPYCVLEATQSATSGNAQASDEAVSSAVSRHATSIDCVSTKD
eukprot:2227084-Amphidinium_carterae.1